MTDHPAWLAPALAYIPRWLGYQMRTTEQPGCVLAIAYQGEVVSDVAFGWADQVAGEALTPRHRFRVASHSKSFTAAAIMKLREQGRLKLDDTAGQYVSGLHPAIASATLAQLLSHTAGILRDGPDAAYWAERSDFLNEAGLRAELALPPAIDAGMRLKYSNHGFGLLGLVIEAVTSEPWGVWLQREVVDAVGLKETTPDVPANGPLARGHTGKALLGRRLIFPGDQSTHALAAATGFVSTAADLARFFGQLSPGAATSVLSAASRREMSRPQWEDKWAALPQKYGLGTISGSFDGWDMFGHSGGFPGYVTRSAVIPEHDLALSCLTNAVDGMSHVWLDGALSILKALQGGRRAKRGAGRLVGPLVERRRRPRPRAGRRQGGAERARPHQSDGQGFGTHRHRPGPGSHQPGRRLRQLRRAGEPDPRRHRRGGRRAVGRQPDGHRG